MNESCDITTPHKATVNNRGEIPDGTIPDSGSPRRLWIAAAIIYFSDGKPGEMTVLHEGDEKSCRFVCDNTHAVAYSGDRPFASAQALVMEIPPGRDKGGEDQGENVNGKKKQPAGGE